MKRVIALAAGVILAAAISGCTTTQEAVSGAAAGGVAGLAVAGPIGAAVGAGGGAIVTPMMTH